MAVYEEWLAQPQAKIFIHDLEGSEEKMRAASNNHLRSGETVAAAYNLGRADGVKLMLDFIRETREGA